MSQRKIKLFYKNVIPYFYSSWIQLVNIYNTIGTIQQVLQRENKIKVVQKWPIIIFIRLFNILNSFNILL